MDMLMAGMIVTAYILLLIVVCFYFADKINNSEIWKKYWE